MGTDPAMKKFLAAVVVAAAGYAGYVEYGSGKAAPPPTATVTADPAQAASPETELVRECDCRKELDAHLKNGLCSALGGVTIQYRGGYLVLHGVPELAAGVDGGAAPPNFDGVKAALANATSAVVGSQDRWLAAQVPVVSKDGGGK